MRDDLDDLVRWYDKQGRPVTIEEWAALTKDDNYRIVQQTSGAFWWISTVLLGLDHGHAWGPRQKPVIFETMVFTKWRTYRRGSKRLGIESWWCSNDVDMQRYCTLAQAKGGHLDMVSKWTGVNGLKRFVAYLLGILE